MPQPTSSLKKLLLWTFYFGPFTLENDTKRSRKSLQMLRLAACNASDIQVADVHSYQDCTDLYMACSAAGSARLLNFTHVMSSVRSRFGIVVLLSDHC